MSDTSTPISIFVKNLFPSFFNTEGPRFVAFVEAYYEWLEEQGNVVQRSRQLTDLRDIDNTINDFLSHFREKYLLGMPLNGNTSVQDLVKHAVELYRAKGSTKAVEFLFLLLFNTSAKVYFPGTDVLRPSDGTWYVPRYLELSRSDKSFEYVGKTILGTISGATALVERVDRRSIDGKIFDVAYLSQIKGAFQTNEIVVQQSTGEIKDAPRVIGSLTQIDILSAGQGFNVGDIVNVVSSSLGQDGKGRVTAVTDATGRVNFTLVDGGSGYTNTASVLISDKVIGVNNFAYANSEVTSYVLRETVIQPLINVAYSTANTTFTVGQTVQVLDAGLTVQGSGVIVGTGTGYVMVQNTSGSFTSTLYIRTSPTAGAVISTVTNRAATATLIKANNSHIGVKNIANVFYGNGAFITSTYTGITANVTSLSTGQDATFSIGNLSDTENLFLNTDLIGANNYLTPNVPYTTVSLNATQYGFPKLPSGNVSYILNTVLTINTYTIGTIASIVGINPGTNYNTDPLVTLIEDKIAPFDRRNLLLLVNNINGSFIVGEDINQQYAVSGYTLNLNTPSADFTVGETVQQGSSYGQVAAFDTVADRLTLYTSSTFNTSANVNGLTSGATSVVTTAIANSQFLFTKGTILTSNSTALTLKRKRFATSFADGLSITGDLSGATANVVDVFQIANTPVMGNNAVVTADAGTANGTITSVEVMDSGLAYYDGETVTITANGNPYIATGIARLLNQGTGSGYWTTDRGYLNTKLLHDNNYYQDYSYEIQSSISLDRYAEIIRQVTHVAGTKLFGRVEVEAPVELTLEVSSTIEPKYSVEGNPTLALDFINDFYYTGG